jgi:2-succinyl-5-enolpyruvyl-6-hydroxy-3-cyclohexene-1-carboxylate synthase
MSAAVAEAHYRGVPLLVISADRPESWIGQMDGQTIDQQRCFGDMARSFVLREGDDEETLWYRNRIVNEALSLLRDEQHTPVHINVHLSEPLFSFVESELPEERYVQWQRHTATEGYDLSFLGESCRTLLVIGQMVPPSSEMEELVTKVITENKALVVAENLSNLTYIDGVIANVDAILAQKTLSEDMAPERVIYVGGHIVSKRLKQYLRRVGLKCCIRLTEANHIEDTFMCVTHQFGEKLISSVVSSLGVDDSGYIFKWHELSESVRQERIDDGYSMQGVVSRFMDTLPEGASVSLANSSSVRYAQTFVGRRSNTVYCNRGVNGIDGSLSSAVGQALGTDGLVYAVIGDLSFFYDMNALWNVMLPSNLRVLLVNNGGGEIFRMLPGLEKSEHRDRYVMAEHRVRAEGWARDAGCRYIRVEEAEQFEQAMEHLLSASDRCVVVEVVFHQ